MSLDYKPKTTPFEHQRRHLEERWSQPSWGLLWEQGTGKTKPIIDTACALFEAGRIDALVVVAPNGVHRNWINDEIPAHMPDRVQRRTLCFYWQTQRSKTISHKQAAEQALRHDGLLVFAISYDGFMTEAGKKFAWRVLSRRRCLYTLDEAHSIKTPRAKRTKSIVASGKYAPYRRIATGTPISIGPFDIYSQVKFLDEGFWSRNGLGSYAAFKQHFGVWRTREQARMEHGYDPGYDLLLDYRNLDELRELLARISDRVTKDEVLDLPPKLYSKRYFDMTPEQRRAYEQLRTEFILELESGAEIDGSLAIVRLLRLQQIACGYAQTSTEEPVHRIGDKNPRLDAALELLEPLGHKAIIWCRFRHDIDQLMDALGKRAVRYDGSVSDDEAERGKNEFQRGDAQWFVGNAAKGGSGLTLTAARTVLYYSNSFNLVHRLQSEDRPHRIGQEHSVNIIDLIANDTVDMHIVKALRGHLDVASKITGDQLREWI